MITARAAPVLLVLFWLLPAHAFGQSLGRDEVKNAVEEVVNAPEFLHLAPREPEKEQAGKKSWIAKFLEGLLGRTDKERDQTSPIGGAAVGFGALVTLLLYLLAAAVVAAVILLIIRAIGGRARAREGDLVGGASGLAAAVIEPAVPPGEQPARFYLEKALALARSGDFRAAIAQLLLGTMSWVERAELIRHRRGLTNRDYLRAVRRRPDFRLAMAAIVRSFEEIHFGRRPATADGFQTCLGHFQREVRDGGTETPPAP